MASSAKHLWDKQVVLLRWGSELSRAFPWLSTSQSGVRLSRLLECASVLLYLQPPSLLRLVDMDVRGSRGACRGVAASWQ